MIYQCEGFNPEYYLVLASSDTQEGAQDGAQDGQQRLFLPTRLRQYWANLWCSQHSVEPKYVPVVEPFEASEDVRRIIYNIIGTTAITAKYFILWNGEQRAEGRCDRPLLKDMPVAYYASELQSMQTCALNRALIDLGFYLPQETLPPEDDWKNAEQTQTPPPPPVPPAPVEIPKWVSNPEARGTTAPAPEAAPAPEQAAKPEPEPMSDEDRIKWARALTVEYGQFRGSGITLGQVWDTKEPNPSWNNHTGPDWVRHWASERCSRKYPQLHAAADVLLRLDRKLDQA